MAKKLEDFLADAAKKLEEKKPKSTDSTTDGKQKVTNDTDITVCEKVIIRQVEYYFSAENLSSDKYLCEKLKNNKNGWMPIIELLNMKRLAVVTTNPNLVATALKKSTKNVVTVSEDCKNVRRTVKFEIDLNYEKQKKKLQERTVCARGFPPFTQLADLQEFFSAFYPESKVKMGIHLNPKTKTHTFSGSAFITFKDKHTAHEFIEKDKVIFKNHKIIRMSEADYYHEYFLLWKLKLNKEFKLQKGATIHFEGASPETTPKQICEAVNKNKMSWFVVFIDFIKGDNNGYFRLHKNDTAQMYIAILGNKLKINHKVVLTLRAIEGYEEKVFLETSIQRQKNLEASKKYQSAATLLGKNISKI